MKRVLGIDPGAIRCGWAVIQKDKGDYTYIDSSIDGVARLEKEAYQLYRRRLINFWMNRFQILLNTYNPDSIVYEILPAVGAGNFIIATQAELAKTVITTCEVKALGYELDIRGIAANTVKKQVTGTAKATKVQVRNAVIDVFPQLNPRKREILADETDAIAITLASLGFKKGKNEPTPASRPP